MPRKKYSPPNYCNEIEEVTLFGSQREAESWLEGNRLDIKGLPLLIPFKNAVLDRVEFLKPRDPDDRLRIMGPANHLKSKNRGEKFIKWMEEQFTRDFAPHLNDLDGDTIILEKNVFITIYVKGQGSVGQKFAKCFRELREKLIKKIEKAPTNITQLNPAEFFEVMSKLALDLDIGAGMNYFFDENTEKLYRQTFCRDASDENQRKICLYMEHAARAKKVIVHNNKVKNNHSLSFCKDLITGVVFAAIVAVVCGALVFAVLGKMAVAGVIVATMIGLSLLFFYKASRDNPTTFDFPDSGLKTSYPSAIQNTNFFNALKVYLANLFGFSPKLEQLPTQASQPAENAMVTQGSETISQAHSELMPNSSVAEPDSYAEPKKRFKILNWHWIPNLFKLSCNQQSECENHCVKNTGTHLTSIPAAA